MYTKLDDIKMAKKIMDYVEKNPTANRKKIIKYCFTNWRRLNQLEAEGYINILPPTPLAERNREWRENKTIQSEST
jgi:hypothetical protein